MPDFINEPIEWFAVLAAIGGLVYIVGFIRYWRRSQETHRKVYRMLHGRERPW